MQVCKADSLTPVAICAPSAWKKNRCAFAIHSILTRAAGIITLQNRAMATSATYFSRKRSGDRMRSALVDAHRQRAFVDDVSVTVSAETCMTADALTKIVFALRDLARPILIRHRADAVILERDLVPRWFTP